MLNPANQPSAQPMIDTGIDDWVKSNRLYWAGQTILPWDEKLLMEVTPFVTSHFWSDRHSINVYSVIGTAHPDYINLSWERFLEAGKRMSINKRLLVSNPGYYLETDVKHPPMQYVSLDGERWYLNGDGNHRTCLARFHFERLNANGIPSKTMIHGVAVDSYRVDWALLELYRRIKRVLQSGRVKHAGHLECTRDHVAREDGPAWKLDSYKPDLRYVQPDGAVMKLDWESATRLLVQLERGSRSGILGRFLGR
jgi:hypothetical protein